MLRKYTAYFIVEVDGYDTGIYTDAGFYPADSFSEAVDYLEEFYGNELIVIKHLELLDIDLIAMTPDKAKEILDRLY